MNNVWRARSEDELDYVVTRVREVLGFSASERVQGRQVLERFAEKWSGFRLEIAPDEALPGYEGEAYPAKSYVRLAASTHSRFLQGDPRATLTVIEELAHLLLGHDGAMHRAHDRDRVAAAISRKARQEREAKYFSAAFLAPTNAALECKSAEEIRQRFGLSKLASEIRFNEISALRRRKAATLRSLSEDLKQRLRAYELETGHKLKRVDLERGTDGPPLPPDVSSTIVLDQLPAGLKQGFGRNGPDASAYLSSACIECGAKMQRTLGPCIRCENCGASDCD